MAGIFKPFLDDLNQKGVNINPLINSSGLKNFNLEKFENYVPIKLMYSLFEEIQRKVGVDDFLAEFGKVFKLQSLAQIGEVITLTPDLYSACCLTAKYNQLIISSEEASIEIDGPKTTLKFNLTDMQSSGKEKMEQISFAICLNGIRIAAGKDWSPDEIQLQQSTAPNLDALLPEDNRIKLKLNQPAMAVVFPTELLTRPMLGVDRTEPEKLINSDISLVWKINKLLDSNLGQSIFSLHTFSEIAEVSVSTFKRKLAAENTTFKETLDKWRFKTAIESIKNERLKVKELSEELGYANEPNFIRAFKRWTNTSPNQYREMLKM